MCNSKRFNSGSEAGPYRIYRLLEHQDFRREHYKNYAALLEIPLAPETVRWPIGVWAPRQRYRTPDLAALLQPHIDSSDFEPGSYVGLRLSGDRGAAANGLEWLRYAGSSETPHPPILEVSYSVEP